ncbi:hypothetical protein KCP75_10115 [Salmonella enterica subsp. enterica]|nr:hypothetical protein KCP75_10115 [Salmonella enterica subsp. enterica]
MTVAVTSLILTGASRWYPDGKNSSSCCSAVYRRQTDPPITDISALKVLLEAFLPIAFPAKD